MLILTRRPTETIEVGTAAQLGSDILITILEVRGNQVRIGIQAPKQISVHREEIAERIRNEQRDGVTPRGNAR